jgi:uncharacterized repeat protein (TIGR03803 family)
MTVTNKLLFRSNGYLVGILPVLMLTCLVSIAHGEATFEQLRGFAIEPSSPEGEVLDAGDGYLYGTTFQGGAKSSGSVYRIKKDGSSFDIIHSFDSNCLSGCFSQAGLIFASDGFLYGTTASGGASGVGTLFRVRPDGNSFRPIHEFKITDGAGPQAGLILGADGYLYGTTSTQGPNGAGTVFRVKTNGSSFTTLHGFSGADGAVPQANLVLAADGFLYGTTTLGGLNDLGTVFRVKSDGSSFNNIYSFNGSDGAHPRVSVTYPVGEFLYGTTSSGGGPTQAGTIFRIKPDGTSFSTIYNFNGSGASTPSSRLILATDGYFYGTTGSGGPGGLGTVFRVNPDGTSFNIVHAFSSCSEGCFPQNIILASDGYLYGTTAGGSPDGPGSIFRVKTDGTSFSFIHAFSFCESGCSPQSGVLLAADGFLYGTTIHGGPTGLGTIFRINPNGTTFGIVHGFDGDDGASPAGDVIRASDGFLYGTTPGGGAFSNGTVFKVQTDGTSFSTIHSFFCSNGCGPQAGVILAPDGFLYGTTVSGGATFSGTVFRVMPDGTSFSTVYSFNGSDGANPQAGVILAPDGYLYGATANGGLSGVGTVFRVRPDGTSFSVVHSFNGSDGANPQGGVNLAADGFLYGTTFNGGALSNGTVFRVKPDGSSFNTFHDFNGDDGANPQGNIILGSDGFLYGSTFSGGRDFGGTVFRVKPDGTSFGVIYNFIERGFAPLGSITMKDGFIYGTTSNGGTGWAGTVYRLKLNPEP